MTDSRRGRHLSKGTVKVPSSKEPRSAVSPERSALMARVRQKGTKPELTVRRCLHYLGFRFRLHKKDLPGTPDIVLPKHRKVIFVHGCYWHRHPGCARTTTPKTRAGFWTDKFRTNVHRDWRNMRKLRESGWEPYVVWECETNDIQELETNLKTIFSTA